MQRRIDRMPALMERTGWAKSTVWHHVKHQRMTAPIKIGPRAVGWPSDEIDAILQARIAGADDQAIRALVVELTQRRAANS